MDQAEIEKYIMDMPDEVMSRFTFSMPWQYDTSSGGYKDPDGFPVHVDSADKEETKLTRDKLQKECWDKFNKNPQINTATRGTVGRLTGYGFEVSSEIQEIAEAIEEVELDPRNRLYNYWPKFVGRTIIEGELFLSLTCHSDGFVEVDFVDPISLYEDGDDDSGIIFHPDKAFMPLIYTIKGNNGDKVQVPSIYVAHYPELINIASKSKKFNQKLANKSRSRRKKFRDLRGYFRFIVAWDRSFITRRATSYMKTTLTWLNHYENLKKYEIDHKKSSGAYLWIFSITEPRAFKQWLSLSDEDRRKTGIMAKKTPGSSLVLPPGVEVECKNPNLTKISEQDSDILEMISSGLNEPEDVLMNRAKGTYASLKASRGPMNDRTSDEVAYFERFLKYDFWDSIFWLKSKLDSKFKYVHKIKEAVRFDDKGEPVFENRKRKASQLVDITFPVSESIDYESRSSALMGVKHGPASETLGVPTSEIAKRLGFGNYGRLRLRYATEKEKYPELVYTLDAESLQEQVEAEPKGKTTPQSTKKPAKQPAKKQGE